MQFSPRVSRFFLFVRVLAEMAGLARIVVGDHFGLFSVSRESGQPTFLTPAASSQDIAVLAARRIQ